MIFSHADEAQDTLRQEGWLVSEMELASETGPFWIVFGHRGSDALRGEGVSREEAWRRAWEQAHGLAPASIPAPVRALKETLSGAETAAGHSGELFRFEGARYWIDSVAFSPDGRAVVTGSGQPLQSHLEDSVPDFSVRIWDLESGRELQRFLGHTHWVMSVAFSPDGQRLLSGSYDGTMRLWDVAGGKELHCFRGHGDRIRSVAYAPDGRHGLSASYDRTLRLWDLATGQQVHAFEGHANWVTSVAISPDRRRALSGSFDQTVRLWDLEGLGTGRSADGWFRSLWHMWPMRGKRELARLEGHRQNVTSVAFSPDGRRALSASIDQTVRLWDLTARTEIRCLKGHGRGVMSVVFAPDGRHALSGGMDHRVLLWDLETGREVYRYEGHTDIVTCVAFAPDGRHALSASADQTMRLLNLPRE